MDPWDTISLSNTVFFALRSMFRSGTCVNDLQELEEAFGKEQSLATFVSRALADLAYTVAVLAFRGATTTPP